MAAPLENKNAEKWTEQEAESFMRDALEISKSTEYDFIGEVAKKQNSYHHVYSYLSEKYPGLKNYYKAIKANCESNCFYNGKKGSIVPSLAIMNLKSNHGWTDRVDSTSGDKPIKNNIIVLGNGIKPDESTS